MFVLYDSSLSFTINAAKVDFAASLVSPFTCISLTRLRSVCFDSDSISRFLFLPVLGVEMFANENLLTFCLGGGMEGRNLVSAITLGLVDLRSSICAKNWAETGL